MRLRPGSVFAVKEDLSEDGKVDHDLKTTANNELEKNRINWLNLFFFKSLYWFATFTTISMKFTLRDHVYIDLYEFARLIFLLHLLRPDIVDVSLCISKIECK